MIVSFLLLALVASADATLPIGEKRRIRADRGCCYADIRSIIETARRRAIGALEAIRLTMAGMPLQNLA